MGGMYFDDLEPGRCTATSPVRTVTAIDNVLFSALTMNLPLHLDAEFAAGTEFGERIVNSLFRLGLLVGLGVHDLTLATTVTNLGFEAIDLPLRHGDTLRAESEVVATRSSKSRPAAGIVVTVEHRGRRQDGVLVARCRRASLMHRRPLQEGADP